MVDTAEEDAGTFCPTGLRPRWVVRGHHESQAGLSVGCRIIPAADGSKEAGDCAAVSERFHILCDAGSTRAAARDFARSLTVELMIQLSGPSKSFLPRRRTPSKTMKTLSKTVESAIERARSQAGSLFTGCQLQLCVLHPEQQLLCCFSVGNGKTIVLRDREIVYHSGTRMANPPLPDRLSNDIDNEVAVAVETFSPLKVGDLVLTVSDGVTMALLQEELELLISHNAHLQPQEMADVLAQHALKRARAGEGRGPMARLMRTVQERKESSRSPAISPQEIVNVLNGQGGSPSLLSPVITGPFAEAGAQDDSGQCRNVIFTVGGLEALLTRKLATGDDVTVCCSVVRDRVPQAG